MSLNKSIVEDAAPTWFGGLGFAVPRGLDIVPGELAAEQTTCDQAVLFRRLRDALVCLNPPLPRIGPDDGRAF